MATTKVVLRVWFILQRCNELKGESGVGHERRQRCERRVIGKLNKKDKGFGQEKNRQQQQMGEEKTT